MLNNATFKTFHQLHAKLVLRGTEDPKNPTKNPTKRVTEKRGAECWCCRGTEAERSGSREAQEGEKGELERPGDR